MICKEYGGMEKPVVILLHGGGLSWWSLEAAAEELSDEYHVVTPVLDGHGENGDTLFISIEESAGKLLTWIDERFGGVVFALGGLSIGAQIVAQMLTVRPGVARCAVIESALVCPIKGAEASAGMMKLFYGLIKKRWFAKWQAQALCVPDALFERYYQDSMRMSSESLANMARSNSRFVLSEDIAKTSARVLVMVGEKERPMMKRSAEILHKSIPRSVLYVAKNLKHGELSLTQPREYAALLRRFFAEPG